LVAKKHRRLTLWRLTIICAIVRYADALGHAVSLSVLAWRFARVLHRFGFQAGFRYGFGVAHIFSTLIQAGKLGGLFRGFDCRLEDTERSEYARLRALYADLQKAVSQTNTACDPLTAPTAIGFQEIAVRHEFLRLLGVGLSTEQAQILGHYGSVGRALVDFLRYCGYNEDLGVFTSPSEVVAGFVDWAEVRHTRSEARYTLNRLLVSRRRLAKWVTAIEVLQGRLEALRPEMPEFRQWDRMRANAKDDLKIRQLQATLSFNPIYQAMSRNRLAQALYLRALGLLATIVGKMTDSETDFDSQKSLLPSSSTHSRSVAIALEALNRNFEAAIST